MVAHLAQREYSERYRDSAIGVLWFLSLPVAQLVVLVFLFQRVVPLGIDAYPAFVFSALLPWSWFSTSVGASGGLFLANRDLVRHPGFSPATLVVVTALSNLLLFVASLPLLLALLAWYGRAPGLPLLALPLLLLIQGTLITGLGLAIATLNVFFRDIQHLVSVVLMLAFYLTPVFYSAQSIGDGRFQWVYRANPMAVLIESYRAVLFNGSFPAIGQLVFAAAVSCAALLVGLRVYRARRYELVDEL
jgi:ABC-type polysaccharide/polyol phosphate export permease